MKTESSRTIPVVVRNVWILSIFLVVFLSLFPKMEIPLEFRESDKVAHFVAYLWLAVLPFFAFPPPSALRRALFMIPMGIALEFAQIPVPGRDFSLGDMGADSLGVVLGIVLAGALKKRTNVQA